MSEHDVYTGIPSSVKTLLRNIKLKSMKRTTNQNGIFYYRGKIYDGLRVILDTKKNIITFKRELQTSTGIRTEELIYDFNNQTLTKTFREPGSHLSAMGCIEFPFVNNEETHFMQSTIQYKYFPSYDEFVNMRELKDGFIEDVYSWITERNARIKERKQRGLDYWRQKNLGIRKVTYKAKPTSL